MFVPVSKKQYEIEDFLEAEIRMITKLIHQLFHQVLKKAIADKKKRK